MNKQEGGEPFEQQRLSAWASVIAPTPITQPHYLAIHPCRPHLQSPPIVGGLLIGLSDAAALNQATRQLQNERKRRGDRSKDRKTRRP